MIDMVKLFQKHFLVSPKPAQTLIASHSCLCLTGFLACETHSYSQPFSGEHFPMLCLTHPQGVSSKLTSGKSLHTAGAGISPVPGFFGLYWPQLAIDLEKDRLQITEISFSEWAPCCGDRIESQPSPTMPRFQMWVWLTRSGLAQNLVFLEE